MAFSGNLQQAMAGIKHMQHVLSELSKVPEKAAQLAAPEISRLVKYQFRQGHDPYGTPWAKLAKRTLARGRRPPPLTDTGLLANSVRATVVRATGIRIMVTADYGYFHQVGTKWMPRRPIVPQYALPATWKMAINRAVAISMRRATEVA
jgi:hypothetical protein